MLRELTSNSKSSELIRESYRNLPFQGLWTWLTGKELKGRKPLWNTTTTETLLWPTLWLISGILGSIYILNNKLAPYLLVLTTILTVSGARYLVATTVHQAIHHSIYKKVSYNKWIAEVLSTILLVQPYHSYRQFHIYEHHGQSFSSINDKDLAALYSLGFTPGKSVLQMKSLLLITCLNPIFHTKFLFERIKSNLVNVPPYRKLMTVAWNITLAFVAHAIGFTNFIISIAFPLTLAYQACSLLHLITEHAWVCRDEQQSLRDAHINNSLARFCGTECPSPNEPFWPRMALWAHWWMVHLFFHLPIRMLILQGTLIVHDWHHRFGGHKNWPNAIQLREKHVQALDVEGNNDYIEVWGFHNVLEYTLSRISEGRKVIPTGNISYRLN